MYGKVKFTLKNSVLLNEFYFLELVVHTTTELIGSHFFTKLLFQLCKCYRGKALAIITLVYYLN